MENPYGHVIRELEAEIARIRQAIYVLKQRAPHEGDGAESQRQLPIELPEIAQDDLTNEQAVDQVLQNATEPLTVKEIGRHSERLLGKTLNVNSVRWVLHHGTSEGRYRKEKRGNRNFYSFAPEG